MKIIAERDIKYVKFTAWFFILLAALGLLLKAGQVKKETFELVIGQAGLFGVLILISLGRVNELLGDCKKTTKTAPVFIMAGILLGWGLQAYRETARQYGILVAPGAGQVNVPNPGVITIDTVMIIASIILLGPLLEEMLFRFIGLGLVRQLAGPRQAAFLIGAWVMVTSTAFALLHSPEPASFVIYFIPSLVYSLVYLRYGVFGSFIVHSAGNAWVLIS
ncbi:CAAX amino terminal protease self- immunity [Sporotomaculum syntrophicum]|uniref:CAAX amino terminal protease self- immunity n=1 Tax=Sporotomaculum syntrophicum TaxID=182264 RepID=A0A9D2WN96_9FIRM|nr:CPBP family glutamic-type intramembrane protease [Sporotomaculum syntrophicum]KAF1083886.1 CAAX amino terminal protease self- immunity [Sporotomaculum syntrophicum]